MIADLIRFFFAVALAAGTVVALDSLAGPFRDLQAERIARFRMAACECTTDSDCAARCGGDGKP